MKKINRIFRAVGLALLLLRYDKKAEKTRELLEKDQVPLDIRNEAVAVDILWYSLTETTYRGLRGSINKVLKMFG